LNISVQAADLSDCRIESNRNYFGPNWNAVLLHYSAKQKYWNQGTESEYFARYGGYFLRSDVTTGIPAGVSHHHSTTSGKSEAARRRRGACWSPSIDEDRNDRRRTGPTARCAVIRRVRRGSVYSAAAYRTRPAASRIDMT